VGPLPLDGGVLTAAPVQPQGTGTEEQLSRVMREMF
jgi:hypothetical protein